MAGSLFVLGGAMASAVAPGGVGPEASSIEHSQVSAVEYVRCADMATTNGPDEVVGMDTEVTQSSTGTKMTYRMESQWEGPLFTDEGIACGGIVNYRGSVQIKSGKYAQRLDGNKFALREKAQSPAATGEVKIKGYATSRQVCALARELQGKKAPIVSLVRKEKRTYSQAGYPQVTTENSVPLGTLDCDPRPGPSGGIGTQGADGSGGVAPK